MHHACEFAKGLILAIVSVVTFVSSLIYSLCPLQSDHKWALFYLPKISLVGVLWLSAILLACWQEYEARGDPTFNYKADSGNYIVSIVYNDYE